MNENGGKSSTILLTVIGIATLLVVVVGATFAYFAAQTVGDAQSITVTAASDGTVIQFMGGEEARAMNIYPRTDAWIVKPIKLTYTAVAESTTRAKYTFNITASNPVGEKLTYTFEPKSTAGITGETHVSKKQLVTETAIATGIVALNTATPIEYTLSVFYDNDPNVNQNTGKKATIRRKFHENLSRNRRSRIHRIQLYSLYVPQVR